LKLDYDEPLSNSAFKFNLRRYMTVCALGLVIMVILGVLGRGLHSFTSQLNLSAFYEKGVRVGVV